MDDGSADRSAAMLREQFEKRPDLTRVVLLQSNFGQHAAILAGFSTSPRRAWSSPWTRTCRIRRRRSATC